MRKDKLRFTGRGFSREPLSDEELAEMRERNKHYDDHFLSVDDLLKEAGLAWVASAARGFVPFARAAAVIASIGGALAYLNGWIL